MNALAAWLDQHTGGSPAMLAARTRAYALAAPARSSAAETLAAAAHEALTQALAQTGDRAAALDLLAGDALMTLALLTQAESDPAQLGPLASSLMRPERFTL